MRKVLANQTELKSRLKLCYENYRHVSKAPLYNDFDTYLESLPTRSYPNSNSGGQNKLRLYEYPFIAKSLDMSILTQQLQNWSASISLPHTRSAVNYIVAPPGSGKSACILPAFLESQRGAVKFTHYLYLAFENNGKRTFKAKPSKPHSDPDVAVLQGAQFIFQCLRVLLNDPGNVREYVIDIEKSGFSLVEEASDAIFSFLNDSIGENFVCLVHLDEHKKMCSRNESHTESATAFSRGAMTALADVPGVTVVATFTDVPPLLIEGSSRVCRRPVVLPNLDINLVIQNVQELQLNYPPPAAELNQRQRRLLATLKFRLAVKIVAELGIIALLHKRGTRKTQKSF